MKPIGSLLPHNWKEMMDEAIQRAEEKKLERIRTYDWPDDCECDLCGDTGVDPERQSYCNCDIGRDKQARAKRKEAWQYICPEKYRDFRLSTHPNAEAAKAVQSWLREGFKDRRGLILSGSVGSGKTALALAAMYEIHMQGYTCMFDTFSMILNQLRPKDSGDMAAKRENLQGMIRKGLLVIDDLGTHKESEWTAQMLFDLINARTSEHRPFIITTNLDNKGMEKMLDPRIVSRLAEFTDFIPVNGKDMRRTPR